MTLRESCLLIQMKLKLSSVIITKKAQKPKISKYTKVMLITVTVGELILFIIYLA